MRRISEISVLKRILFPVLVLILAGCSLEKESALNRGLQNLTAHYNILFNANELLRQKQESYALSFVDAYNEILNVYQDTIAQGATADKDLEDAKVKANKIITIKEQSHYLGDAYLVLGKANYLEGDYFQAVEFFSYVIRSFPSQVKLKQEALVWKARSLIYLHQLPQAKLVLDTALVNINPKKRVNADVYATKMQYDIAVQDYANAEEMGKLAIQDSHEKAQRLRWTFIVGQLQELNNKNAEAFKNYTRIVKSNASFEMAFNANLNRIRIADNQNGTKVNRIDRLKSLIGNENNKDFIDQIYYQIAELYLANNDIDHAVKNYKLSVRYSKKNQNQKGLSYLRLADINFKNKADYVSAKKYYDSTLFNLSPNYPGYALIQKKSNNLQLLADRYGIISREDTLQMLAQLDEKTRAARIDAMVNREILQQTATDAVNAANAAYANSQTDAYSGGSGGSFYFYNSNAVSQGYSDFKRRWGNRKLEDNWRRSSKANNDAVRNTAESIDPDAPAEQVQGKGTATAANYRRQLAENLPLTPALLAQSNARIYAAYFDIANFYRDILGDKKEAIANYEILLSRFPDNPDKPALYYNLYRLYSGDNEPKSAEYKNLLLKNYPDTPFAKVINDPEYSKKLNDADATLTALYNGIYDEYAKKDYKKAIAAIDDMLKQYPGNKWSAQLAYLRAISAGYQEKLTPFKDDLARIIKQYPTDRLIVPLVKQHLAYIEANQTEMAARPVVLTDNGPDTKPFIPETITEQPVINYALQVAQKRIEPKGAVKQPAANQPVANKPAADTSKTPALLPVNDTVAAAAAPAIIKPQPAPSIYSMHDSTNYYFVINVSTATTNLASSRFGIGQFNRANFQEGAITHRLMDVGADNQLIYVGRFSSLDAVKDYARAIIPLMPDIMKVPKDKYSFFIITKENLDKLTTKTRLDSYIDFYQHNY